MIKLLDARSLGNSNYEIIVSHNGVKRKFIIVNKEFFVEEMNDYFSYFNSDDNDFYNVRGHSLEFRKSVSSKIKQLKEAEIPELQAA